MKHLKKDVKEAKKGIEEDQKLARSLKKKKPDIKKIIKARNFRGHEYGE